MKNQSKLKVDVSKMNRPELLKLLETEWEDHFQTRRQTWKALEVAALITVAVVGVQWKSTDPSICFISSVLLIFVSLFGMQITLRHRNSVEVAKFTIITEIEKHLNFQATDLNIPKPIEILDIIRFRKSNTSLFILRMHGIIFLLAIVMLILSIADMSSNTNTYVPSG